MVDLSVKFAGLDFKNPISIASHAPFIPQGELHSVEEQSEWDMELWGKYYEGGVGSITTGTIWWEDMPACRGVQRFHLIKVPGFAPRGAFVDAATMPDALWSRTPGLLAVKKAKKKFTDMRVIASIMGPDIDPEGWGKLALEAQQAGADAVELNLASTMMPDTWGEATASIVKRKGLPPGGNTIGLIPEVVNKIIKGIKKKVSVPVIVKVTPELGFYGLLGALPFYQEAKLDGVVCSHAVMSVPPPDIYNGGKTTHPHLKVTTWWSAVGPWTRFACYRDIPIVAKNAPDIDIEACGGLVIPEQTIEVMMLGAKIVQLSAGIHLNGPSYTRKVVNFLKKYMEEQGYKSVNDFIGLGLKCFVEMGEMQEVLRAQAGKVIAKTDYKKCVGPEKCKVCIDNWCVATYVEKGQVKIDPKKCCACNLCVIRCPHEARSLIDI